MSADANSKAVPALDDPWSIAAIAVLAFVLADVTHEVIGHGIGFILAGGKACVLTTTRLIAEHQELGDFGGRVFDMGGPFGNLFAAIAWLGQRVLKRPAPRGQRSCPFSTLRFWGQA